MTALFINQEFLFALLGIVSMFALVVLSFTLIIKSQQIKQLNETVNYFKNSLEEMDEQAKLIVRTDLELNKIQEELDRRINGLYALQRISQNLSKTLEQNEIFSGLNQECIQEIGFQKMLIFTKSRTDKVYPKHIVGFTEEDIEFIENEFTNEGLYDIIRERNSAISSISKKENEQDIISKTANATKLNAFIIAPISKKEGFYGFILLGNETPATPLTVGDEELVAILATQIGQALDNAELFETVYSQHQELEKKVAERTKELTDALSELNIVTKRKTDFVSTVSHELRTPLTSIKGYASILLSEKLGKIPAEIKERLEKINKHSDELTHLVNDLLDIARIESGRIEMKLEKVDINHIAEAVVDLLGPQLKEKAITVEQNIPKDIFGLADSTQISRVFINLIGNAIKFVPEKNGFIKISNFEAAEGILIKITDNGIGMSPTDAERIFEEFYRVDNVINQKVKGTGLGLTLVKNIIQAHKGKIWVESKLNEGSTFNFTLPKAEEKNQTEK